MINYLLISSLIFFFLSFCFGSIALIKDKTIKKIKLAFYLMNFMGVLVLIILVLFLWITNKKAPLQTLGETRLWYSLLLPIMGYLINKKLNVLWPLIYCLAFSILFLLIDFFNQSAFETLLPPALLSVYFIPHVVVYIIAYAILTIATLICFKNTIFPNELNEDLLTSVDKLISVGYAFLTLGLLLGALWAKRAWGHYWTWDPKETWAFITWMMYLLYLHLRFFYFKNALLAKLYLIGAFIMLFICWFGVNYLPTANQSVHTY